MIKAVAIMLLAALAAVLITGPKLVKMARIRGWLPGATFTTEVITQKWQHPGRRGTAYWVALSERDIREVGPHRLNVTRQQWEGLAVGDRLELVRVRGGRHPYLRDGIYASTGNFVLDALLLLIEMGIVLAMIRRIVLGPPPEQPQQGVRF